MNQLATDKRAMILSLLCEGCSMRATSRLADVAFNTVSKLLIEAGEACAELQDRMFVGLKCEKLQLDEIWSFCGAKQGNCDAKMKRAGKGDIWTWTAICADSKLIAATAVGNRDTATAMEFLTTLKQRLGPQRCQITSDGLAIYLNPMQSVFLGSADYAMLIKVYGETAREEQRRYSPAPYKGSVKTVQFGEPKWEHVSTSYVERSNLSIRMGNRRFTRLTNAFSKKAINHAHSVSLYSAHFNFCRVHQTLRCTPAMEAGITDHIWTTAELVALL